MNKKQLIEDVANRSGLSKKQANEAVDSTLASIAGALKKGESVTLVGFGTFQVRDRAEREGRNPRTGETIIIPAIKNPVFKAGKTLKETVN